ncbi:MAG: type II toxin-antitoxin system VapB family antitoxin [Pseudomonadota bacterium]|jgi:antitoxin VapB
MALQIANPTVVAKVERLARAKGMTKTALVEWAVDRLAAESQMLRDPNSMASLLTQLDAIPDRPDADDPMLWDDIGLPR